MSNNRKPQGDKVLSVDDVTAADGDRKKNTLPLRPAHAGVPAAVREDHRGDAVQVPDGVDRTSTTGTGSPRTASTSSNWRAAPWCPTITTSPARRPYQGITIPKAQRATVVRGGILEMDEPEHSTLPRCAEPLPVPRRGQAVAAVRRRDRARGARREDRVGPHRLRRRPRQHRARGAHPGDDGHRAEEVAGLQRARAPVGVHPGALARRPARCRDEPADGHRHDHHHDGGPGEPAAGPDQRAAATAHRRRARTRPGDPGQPRA